ncbi:MAG TPA: hypothetical protein VK933_01820 [Longimicrobiales bacterium]|nr:hypothetical protein [Longimicrobiales bacterium]
MSWSKGLRGVHRWTSVVFTMAVIYVTVVVNTGQEEPAEWVYLLPLLPLGVLLLTGLFLFVLPYSARLRGRSAGGQATGVDVPFPQAGSGLSSSRSD